MSFKLRLVISIVSVVLLTIAMGALIGMPQVRHSYLTALRSALVARVDGVVAVQQLRQGDASFDVGSLMEAPRLLAAVRARDVAQLSGDIEHELRVPLSRGSEGSTFLFIEADGAVLAHGNGEEPFFAAAAKVIAPLVAQSTEAETRVLEIDRRLFEVVTAPLADRATGRRLGTLALCLTFDPIEPLELDNGSKLEVGLRIGDTMYAPTLSPEARTQVAELLASSPADDDRQFTDGSGRYIVYARPIVKSPPTDLVAFTSLAPLGAAERTLLLSLAGAAGAALLVGILRALHVAKVLSRPVADMSAAAVAIEHGDYSVRVPVRDRGELGTLAERFNAMSAGLSLRDHYRRVLDAVTDPEVANELLAGKIDLGGKSQDVGILFCDIRGFTPLTEHMQPQQVIDLINAHMSLLTQVAYQHGGVVDKFVGDLIMVTFGTPKCAPDDAQRMARCALDMIGARARANAACVTPIEIGVGCAFGTVVAGCMGSERRLDYTVLGARVNLAARLCSKAPPMQVYIDEETRMRNPGAICRALEPLNVKGFSAPITAFELRGLPA